MSAKSPLILAIDHGTSGMKTAVVEPTGRIVEKSFVPTSLLETADGGIEQDPQGWLRAMDRAVRKLLDESSVRKRITGLCVSSTFSTTVAIDAHGKPVMNALTWMDSRGASVIQEMASGWLKVQGYSIFKLLPFIRISGGGPTLSGKDDLAHALYIKKEHPGLYEKTRYFLSSKDYLNFQLTGEIAASYDSQTLFWVSDNRNIKHIRYSPKLLRLSGLDRQKLPPLMKATERLGFLTRHWQEKWSLPAVPVYCGSADLQSACVGSGAVSDYEGHIYVGTSSWILAHVPFKKTDLLHTIASLPSAIPGKYFIANEQDMAGGALEKACEWIFSDKERGDKQFPKNRERMAAAAGPGCRNLIFTPWLNGEKTPVDDEKIRGGFHHLSVEHTRNELLRSVYEGVALNSRWVCGYVEKFMKKKFESLNMIGGGAISDLWCQIYADVLQKQIRRTREPRQANARGAAWIAFAGSGHILFEDIPDLIEFDRVFEPQRKNKEIYDTHFKEFVKLYKKSC